MLRFCGANSEIMGFSYPETCSTNFWTTHDTTRLEFM